MRIPEAEIEALLESWPVARLASLGATGWPHQVPIVFCWHAAELWTAVDGKPKRDGELARVANLKRDPRVSVLLDHYDDDWSCLWWIRIEGRAEICEGEGVESEFSEPIAALRRKYSQYESVPLFQDARNARNAPILIRVRPSATRSWRALRGEGG